MNGGVEFVGFRAPLTDRRVDGGEGGRQAFRAQAEPLHHRLAGRDRRAIVEAGFGAERLGIGRGLAVDHVAMERILGIR